MKVVFLSGLYPKEIRKKIEAYSKNGIQYAANTLQWNFVLGLDANMNAPVQIITAPIIGSFPLLYKKLFLKSREFSHAKDSKGFSVGYCNLAIVKDYFIEKALLNELKYWAKENYEEEKIVIVYGMLSSWVLAAVKIKEQYSNIKLCLIVPDLPEFMSNSKGFIYKMREYLQPNLYQYISMFDSFVFLTDEMANHFKVNEKPWVRIEGMINPNENVLKPELNDSPGKKVVMYSGTLAERYGIIDLVSAFQLINDPNYELWICGSGNTQKQILSKALTDSRIKFLGLLPREQVLDLQQKATVLVNPRNSEGEYTKYSFPSKIMEYLLSGTPCIMNSLPGIPVEYNKYVFTIKENNVTSLKNKILEVCSLKKSELHAFGASARKFVLEQKNYTVQTKKMIDMFKFLS